MAGSEGGAQSWWARLIPELIAQRVWLYRIPAFLLEPPSQREGSAAVFLNKEGSRGFGESSVSPTCIQHRSPPPADPRGSRPPGYLWSWSARAFVSPSADLPTFLNFPALCYLRGKILFPGRETTARRPHPASKPRASHGRPTLWPAGVPELPWERRLQEGLRLCQIRAVVLRPRIKAASGKKASSLAGSGCTVSSGAVTISNPASLAVSGRAGGQLASWLLLLPLP